jgi:hypothetical protein
LRVIAERGGTSLVQDPEEAETPLDAAGRHRGGSSSCVPLN